MPGLQAELFCTVDGVTELLTIPQKFVIATCCRCRVVVLRLCTSATLPEALPTPARRASNGHIHMTKTSVIDTRHITLTYSVMTTDDNNMYISRTQSIEFWGEAWI